MPSSKKQSDFAKGINAFTYELDPNGVPKRPTPVVLRARWYKALLDWLPKQDERVPELCEYGYITNKHITIVSSYEHATDLHLLNEVLIERSEICQSECSIAPR